MAGHRARRRQRFIDADEREAVGALVAIIREQRPHVVVTYDPNGGYGHPDHVHAHTVTTAAVAAAGTADYPGEPWTVPKFYWTVIAGTRIHGGLACAQARRFAARVDDPAAGRVRLRLSRRRHRRRGRGRPGRAAGQDGGARAHATQVTVGPPAGRCALSNNMALPILAQEHYVLAAGSAGDRDERGWETDLLAGLGLNESARGRLPTAATEGFRMDPDLDPNLQHWQDRLDSFQWVIGSILSQFDSVPT